MSSPEDPQFPIIPEARPARPRGTGPQRPQGPPPQDIGQDAGMRLLLPVGRSVWAIISGYLGLLSLLCLPAPFALITGIVAIYDIKSHPERHGMGRAIFGIVMGALGSLMFIFAIIGSIVNHR